MSKLSYWGRPWVVFDATNKQHRCWFAEFQRNRTWGNCPVRFVVDEAEGELITMMQQQLVSYYVDKEFKKINESKTSKAQRKSPKKHISA
jgi:hypothetical protein